MRSGRLPRMEKEPFFCRVNDPALWGHERCVEVEMEDAEPIFCCVVPAKKAAAGSDFKTVMRKLTKTRREDMKKRVESESDKVESEWIGALEGPRSPTSRTADALSAMGYVRLPGDGATPVLWRRTLDKL